MRTFVTSVLIVLGALPSARGILAREWTLQLDVKGRRLEGTPVKWTSDRIFLLGRDGHLWDFAASDAKNFRKKADSFRAYSQAEMRGQLLREFGRGFEVTGTGHYLVAHPTGKGRLWAQRFEDLYRSMTHYFTARHFSVQRPPFPLVAVVFPNRGEFDRYAARDIGGARGAVGYYSPESNRILQYDMTNGQTNTAQRLETADTIIHEALHQTAFNTGIHSRFAAPPHWVVEGLATMFEAPGVWNSRQYRRLSDRINRGQLAGYRRYFAGRNKTKGAIRSLVVSDRWYADRTNAAYAYGWAMMFYLAERETVGLSRYLKLTASRTPFEPYSEAARLQDFTRVFGKNLEMLETRVDRFIMSLK